MPFMVMKIIADGMPPRNVAVATTLIDFFLVQPWSIKFRVADSNPAINEVNAANDMAKKKIIAIKTPPGMVANRLVKCMNVIPVPLEAKVSLALDTETDNPKSVQMTAIPAISEAELSPRPVKNELSAVSSRFFM